MADFEIAYKKLLATQGMYPYFDEDTKFSGDQKVCSECFNDVGLKLDAQTIGIENSASCPNCGSTTGRKLTKELVRELCYRFFVRGTIEQFNYGGFPLIQMNEQRFNESDIKVSPWLLDDVKLLEQIGKIGLFYYSPRFWMFGEIEPLKELQSAGQIDNVIKQLMNVYPEVVLDHNHPFYRVRINPLIANDILQYDSAPDDYLGINRFDDIDLPILYGSPDLELCMHECRVRVEDQLYMAKIVPKHQLKFLNLTYLVKEDNVTEFESLDLAIHFLFLAGKHSYPICRRIARMVKDSGYDGIIYPSYFSYVRTGYVPFDTINGMSIRKIRQLEEVAQSQTIPNVALFGRPIEEGKVSVQSINKVVINSIRYQTSFGPSLEDVLVNNNNKDSFVKDKTESYLKSIAQAIRSSSIK